LLPARAIICLRQAVFLLENRAIDKILSAAPMKETRSVIPRKLVGRISKKFK
jgi:hypothetical protein